MDAADPQAPPITVANSPLERIGLLAIARRNAQTAFAKAFDDYHAKPRRALRTAKPYEGLRLALINAEQALNAVIDELLAGVHEQVSDYARRLILAATTAEELREELAECQAKLRAAPMYPMDGRIQGTSPAAWPKLIAEHELLRRHFDAKATPVHDAVLRTACDEAEAALK